MSINYVPRVTQLDAAQLDRQVEELFKQLMYQATKLLNPKYIQPILPELELILRTWIFKHSVYDKKCTFGQQMLTLAYKTDNFSRSKLYWYYGFTVGLKYLKERAIYSYTSNTTIQNVVHKMETLKVIGDVMNFLRFVQCGKYPLLIDLVLGLELNADKLVREDLTNFSWTRELLWHNFIELIGTAIALVNIFGLKSRLTNILKYVWWRKHIRPTAKTSKAIMTVNTVCACCSKNPILPHTMGCQHLFCYYCLIANKTADPNFACPKCYYNGNETTKFVMT